MDRVLRGGSWNNNEPDNFRSANRNRNNPTNRNNNNGFRCSSRLDLLPYGFCRNPTDQGSSERAQEVPESLCPGRGRAAGEYTEILRRLVAIRRTSSQEPMRG